MNLDEIKNLRAQTGAGVLDCKKALQECGENFEKALDWLKKRGLARAAKKSLREAEQGRIASYLHGEGRIGALVEVNVETDFAARSEDFKNFTHELCLHITALNPLFIEKTKVPKDISEKQSALFREQTQREHKKAPEVLEKIVQGKMNKWLKEVCLMDQIFLPSSQGEKPQTVSDRLKELIAKLGENILIRRFVRFELGEVLSKKTPDKSSGEIN